MNNILNTDLEPGVTKIWGFGWYSRIKKLEFWLKKSKRKVQPCECVFSGLRIGTVIAIFQKRSSRTNMTLPWSRMGSWDPVLNSDTDPCVKRVEGNENETSAPKCGLGIALEVSTGWWYGRGTDAYRLRKRSVLPDDIFKVSVILFTRHRKSRAGLNLVLWVGVPTQESWACFYRLHALLWSSSLYLNI